MRDLRTTPDIELISEEALHAAIKTSTYAWIAEVDNKPVALWGFYKPSLLADEGFIWMVTTNAVEEHQFTFIRYGRMVLDMMFQKCNLLYGVVHPEFYRSHKFLKFFKFEIGDPVHLNGRYMLVFKRSK